MYSRFVPHRRRHMRQESRCTRSRSGVQKISKTPSTVPRANRSMGRSSSHHLEHEMCRSNEPHDCQMWNGGPGADATSRVEKEERRNLCIRDGARDLPSACDGDEIGSRLDECRRMPPRRFLRSNPVSVADNLKAAVPPGGPRPASSQRGRPVACRAACKEKPRCVHGAGLKIRGSDFTAAACQLSAALL
jgi:hypothetical protein